MPDNTGLNAIAGAAASSAGQVVVDAARNKKQWKYQQRAMDKQQQMNLDTWNMQNAYNTPQQQMQRLQDAGLNPRLIYGEGSSAPNMAGPLDTAQAPVREAAGGKFPDLLNYYQIRQADAQYKQTVMATDLMQKKGALTDIEQGLKNLNLFRETLKSKRYPNMVNDEANMAHWVSLRSEESLINEQRKGQLMDQLGTMRNKQMTGMDLDNAFKRYRNDLSKVGIMTHDDPKLRILMAAAARMNIDLGQLLLEGVDRIKNIISYGAK